MIPAHIVKPLGNVCSCHSVLQRNVFPCRFTAWVVSPVCHVVIGALGVVLYFTRFRPSIPPLPNWNFASSHFQSQLFKDPTSVSVFSLALWAGRSVNGFEPCEFSAYFDLSVHLFIDAHPHTFIVSSVVKALIVPPALLIMLFKL